MTRGFTALDLVVLTHEDTDHLGGALTVLESIEVQALASSLPPAHALNVLAAAPRRCRAGSAWEWDGVRFEFVHPHPGWESARRNNQSCVLRVDAGGASMLLTGDIERAAEEALRGQKSDERLFADVAKKASQDLEEPLSDVHASAAYRRDLARVLARRALIEAAARAAGGR